MDSLGKVRDDVWSLPLFGASAFTSRLLFADSSNAAQFDPATVLFGGASDPRLTAIRQAADGGLVERSRDGAGWQEAQCPPRDLNAFSLYASSELLINDSARVKDGENYGTAANIGSLATNIGVDAQVGSIFSKANVALRDRANVHGDIWTFGTVQRQNATIVSGVVQEHAGLAASGLECATVSFPSSNAGDKRLEPGQTVTLAPGAYANISIKQTASVRLSAGMYYFDSLTVEPQGILNVDMSEGPTRIYVKSGFTHRGLVTQTGGGPERLLFVYLGTSVASIERSLLATIVAPNAKVDLKALANPGYLGGVFAKQVELAPNTTFSRSTFRGSWRP